MLLRCSHVISDQLPEGAVPGHVFVEESESRQSPTVEVQIEEALVEEVAVEEVHEVADEEGEEAPRQAMPAFNGTFAGWVRQVLILPLSTLYCLNRNHL